VSPDKRHSLRDSCAAADERAPQASPCPIARSSALREPLQICGRSRVDLRSRQPCGGVRNHSAVVPLVYVLLDMELGLTPSTGTDFYFRLWCPPSLLSSNCCQEEEANSYLAREEITRFLPNPKPHYRAHKSPPASSHSTSALSVCSCLTNNSLF
jgi:hypothetical protein